MYNSIKYFEEECISKFEKLEDDFIKEPQKLAEYILNLTDELHSLGLRMIQESLEEMNTMLKKRPAKTNIYWNELLDLRNMNESQKMCNICNGS